METRKIIWVLRHAKSDWTTGVEDFYRPLTNRGRRDARAVGGRLAEFDIDLVLCSAARRTEETWEQACLGGAKASRFDSRREFYDTWHQVILNEMAHLDDSVSTLVIVNHQPLVSNLVVALAEWSVATERVAHHFPTAGLARLSFQGGWAALADGDCVLESFERIRAADDVPLPHAI